MYKSSHRQMNATQPLTPPAQPEVKKEFKPQLPLLGQRELPLCGFENPSNFCFLLANLQCILRSIPQIKDYIFLVTKHITELEGPEPNPEIKIRDRTFLFFKHITQLLQTIRKNEPNGYLCYKITSFIKFFHGYMPDFEFGHQQDAHECMSALINEFLDDLAVEMQKKFSIDTTRLIPDIPTVPDDHMSAGTTKYMNLSFIRKLLGGMRKNTLVCQTCNYQSVSVEQFTELILNIPTTKTEGTEKKTVELEDCIKLGFVPERLTGAEMWYCPQCKKNVEAQKSEIIVHTPPTLICVLKRFQTVNADEFAEPANQLEYIRRLRMRNKDSTPISIPVNNLDIAQFTEGLQGSQQYECVGIVSHLGTNRDFGHYVAYTKCLGDWYLFNDEKCHRFKIEAERITTSDAYILVYRKKI